MAKRGEDGRFLKREPNWYRMRKHAETRGGKDPVAGVCIHRDGIRQRVWWFADHRIGTTLTEPFTWDGKAYTFKLYFTTTKIRDGYVDYIQMEDGRERRTRKGQGRMRVVVVTAHLKGKHVPCPKWFRYINEE